MTRWQGRDGDFLPKFGSREGLKSPDFLQNEVVLIAVDFGVGCGAFLGWMRCVWGLLTMILWFDYGAFLGCLR